ncbi:formyltransferase family protein [Halobacterium hubeiense]|uniref:formyltransferase family protein n=1 Tax=Halobacterium hubeiense TaxID=1407499 RepID=UPI003C77D4FC
MPEDPIRVCLLTADETLPAWAAAAVEELVAETAAEVTLVVEDATTTERSAGDAARRLVELREWGVVAAGIELFGDELPAERSVPIRSIEGVADADWVTCEPDTVDGWKHRLPERAVDRMADADVAVRFGFGFLVGDALTAPEEGVLSFHHGDFREYRGQPMGFWEYVHGRDEAGVTLQRINETLDGGEVVTSRRVDVADAATWGEVRQRLFDASEGMLADGVRRLAREDVEPETLAADELGDLYTHPRGRPVLTYLGKTARGVLLG